MAATSVTIEATSDISGASMEKLQAAIQARSDAIKKTIADSTVAASITILRSLKAGTKKAKAKPVYWAGRNKITETDLYGGVVRRGGVYKVVCRQGGPHGHVSHIRPAIGFKPHITNIGECKVYKIEPVPIPDKMFRYTVNKPEKCWYVLCQHLGQAESYAEKRGVRRVHNERGMALFALAMAQAKASTYNTHGIVSKETFQKSGTMSPGAADTAYSAANLTVTNAGFDSGSCGVEFFDALNYSDPAAGGQAALTLAIDKAANSMLGAYAKDEITDLKKPDYIVNSMLKAAFANRASS